LKQFEELQTCPVCDEPRFGIKDGERHRKFSYWYHKGVVIDGQECRQEDGGDIPVNHLHITCSKCQYKWIEAPYIINGENCGDV
jgi:hypothetical protein